MSSKQYDYKERKEGENYLEYKEHSEFFQKFYELRNQYLDIFYKAYIEEKYALEAFRLLFHLIGWTTSQIEMQITLETLREKRKEILKCFSNKETSKGLILMEDLYVLVSRIQQEVEVLPKVNTEEQEDKEPMDTKIKHALTAYELIYGQ